MDFDIEQAVDILVTELRHRHPHGIHFTPAGVLRLLCAETRMHCTRGGAATRAIFLTVKAASERLIEWKKESGENWRARLRDTMSPVVETIAE